MLLTRRPGGGTPAAAFFILLLVGAAGSAARGAEFLRGDANNDLRFDISDPIFTLGYAFQGTRAPPCLDAADANDDGRIDISDTIYSLAFNFGDGDRPPAPFPGTGPDPTADSLSCGPAPSGTGTLLVGIHDTPPDALTEFWITIEEVKVEPASGDEVRVFPPESSPDAELEVNLLDDVGFANVLASIEVPAGDYIAVEIEFDGALARAGAEDVLVIPDSAEVHLALAAPVTVTEGNLTALILDFDLTASLTDGGPGKVLLDPRLSADDDEDEDDHDEVELNEFHGTVVSVDPPASSFVVEVTARQCDDDEPAPVGQLTVVVNDATEFEDLDGLGSLAAGQKVEVEGALQDDGTILAHEVELKDPDEGEDLDDDGIDDSDEGPDHDSDMDNDGTPNSEDDDDDGDDVEDGDDDDHDNDGIRDDEDGDDDNDCIEDGHDDDRDGDGTHNDDEEDSDEDGVPDDDDRDDDNDGIEDSEDDHDDHEEDDGEDSGDDENPPPDPAA